MLMQGYTIYLILHDFLGYLNQQYHMIINVWSTQNALRNFKCNKGT